MKNDNQFENNLEEILSSIKGSETDLAESIKSIELINQHLQNNLGTFDLLTKNTFHSVTKFSLLTAKSNSSGTVLFNSNSKIQNIILNLFRDGIRYNWAEWMMICLG